MRRIMITRALSILVCGLFSWPEWAAAQDGTAYVRFRCDGDNVGAAVSVNGQLRGECPLIIKLPAGGLKIRAQKNASTGYERVFEQDINTGVGSVITIDIELGAQQLTVFAKRKQAALEAQAQREREVQNKLEAQRQAQAQRDSQAKFAALSAAADTGSSQSIVALAEVYESGRYGGRDLSQAFFWYGKAAEQGDTAGMAGLGSMYFNGWGTMPDYTQAEQWWLKAASAGNSRAMNGLALLYKGFHVFPENADEAERWRKAALAAEDGRALYSLAVKYIWDDYIAPDGREALAYAERAQRAGEPRGYWVAGYVYSNGVNVPKDEAEALRWYRLGAEKGCAPCLTELGSMSWEGRGGVRKNDQEAVALFRRAAALGSTDAMNSLGKFYIKGEAGLLRSVTDALYWLRQSVAEGNTREMELLATLEMSDEAKASGDERGLFCFAEAELRGTVKPVVMSPVWGSNSPDKSIQFRRSTLVQFSHAMEAAQPIKWMGFSKLAADNGQCTWRECGREVDGFISLKYARQICSSVPEYTHRLHAQRMRARALGNSLEHTAWVPEGAARR